MAALRRVGLPEPQNVHTYIQMVYSDSEDVWRRSGVWDSLCQKKSLFVEPRDSSLFKDTVNAFTQHVDQDPNGGAVLMAVCRGKMSEGIDFADRLVGI